MNHSTRARSKFSGKRQTCNSDYLQDSRKEALTHLNSLREKQTASLVAGLHLESPLNDTVVAIVDDITIIWAF